jgi:hypothetical protein
MAIDSDNSAEADQSKSQQMRRALYLRAYQQQLFAEADVLRRRIESYHARYRQIREVINQQIEARNQADSPEVREELQILMQEETEINAEKLRISQRSTDLKAALAENSKAPSHR